MKKNAQDDFSQSALLKLMRNQRHNEVKICHFTTISTDCTSYVIFVMNNLA